MKFTYNAPDWTCPKITKIQDEVINLIDNFREINSSLRNEFEKIIQDCICFYEDIIEEKDSLIKELENEIESLK